MPKVKDRQDPQPFHAFNSNRIRIHVASNKDSDLIAQVAVMGSNIQFEQKTQSVGEGIVEPSSRWCEVDVLAELGGFCSTRFTVHADVFPFNRKRAIVADRVQ